MKKKWGLSPISPPPFSIYKHLYLIYIYIDIFIWLFILENFKSSQTSLMNPYVYIIWLQQLDFFDNLRSISKKR